MGREMLGVMMIMGVLLAMVPNTMQQSRLNKTNYIGLILSTASDEALLLDSGYYVHEYTVKKAGRTFNVGKFRDLSVVYVIALAPLSHVSATVQMLLESFSITGIIDYGNAGAISPSLGFGDVAVLKETAFASAWTWQEYESNSNSLEALASLKIGKYNLPEAGENELGSLQYNKIPKYTPFSSKKETFWYYIDSDWYNKALKLKDEVTLDNCVNDACNLVVPSVVYGANGASSDIYVSNSAYAEFLHDKFGFSTVDMKAAATVSEYESNSNSLEALASLKIGKYNLPEAGENELGSLQYNKIPKYTPYSSKKETFWYYIDSDWYNKALKLKDQVTLEKCVNEVCNAVVPSVAYGAKGASSDIYVSNSAYAEFLHDKFGFSTVDRKAAATVSTAVANGVKHIVFRGASNKPGVAGSPINGALASKNTLKMVAAFADQIPRIAPF